MTPRPIPARPGPGQGVGLPPAAPPGREPRRIRVILGGVVVADTTAALRVLETSHPPSYYLPPADIAAGALRRRTGGRSASGRARRSISTSLAGGGCAPRRLVLSRPRPPFAPLRDHVAFYARPMDAL